MKAALLLLTLFLAGTSLLAAAPGTAVLADDVYQLRAGDWRWVRFDIRHQPAAAQCHFEAVNGGEIRAELLTRPNLELLRQQKSHESLTATDVGRVGMLNQYIEDPGEYAVVIENTGRSDVQVHLNVALTFGVAKPPTRYLSSTRRLTVVLLSFAGFFAIVTFSTRALIKAMKADRAPTQNGSA